MEKEMGTELSIYCFASTLARANGCEWLQYRIQLAGNQLLDVGVQELFTQDKPGFIEWDTQLLFSRTETQADTTLPLC